MPQIIEPKITKIVTKDGECHISLSLELNINLNTNGAINVSTQTVSNGKIEKEEETAWAIPDFECDNKIQFGKKEG